MQHAVGVHALGPSLLALPVSLVSLALSACVMNVPPERASSRAAALPPPLERCGEGPGPIEIVAADVVIAVDRSSSTREPTGLDIDGNGTVGEFRYNEYTDRGDSLLSAELAAVRRLIEVARLGGMRFAIVSYSGREDYPLTDSVTQFVDRHDARLEASLTDDFSTLAAAVERIRMRGSQGATSFAPAMQLALRSLNTGDASDPTRRRRVLFLADSPTPVRYAPMERIAYNDARMETQARRAIASRVSFHAFAIGDAALNEVPHALAEIAGATGGTYRIVADPRNLYCQMLAALEERGPR